MNTNKIFCILILMMGVLPIYALPKEIKILRDRPDKLVSHLRKNPNLWMTNNKIKLLFSDSLHKIGRYQESLGLGYQLLLSPLSFFDRGKNYFIIAQNYHILERFELARFYLEKAIRRNNQYYFYYYARMEEYLQNYPLSIDLYQKALEHKFGRKDYIISGYERALHKALIYYKNKDLQKYQEYLTLLKQNPHFTKSKMRIIENSWVW